MKAPFSPYLLGIKDGLKELIALLRRDYAYVSVLATDSKGLAVAISQHAKSVRSETMTTERGVVVRVYRDGQYSEYALNDFDPAKVDQAAEEIRRALAAQQETLKATGTQIYETAMLPDEPMTLFVEKETEQLPETTDVKALVEKLSAMSDRGMTLSEHMIECITNAQSTHVCKMFLSENRDLCQSYVYSEGMAAAVVMRDGKNQMSYEGVSGLCGPELFDQLPGKIEKS